MSVSQPNCFYGQLSQFNSEQETLSAYLERVDIFFQANNIAEKKQVGIFLSLIGAKTYGLLRDLVAPTKPKEKSLAELTKTLRTHFEPRPLIIAERFHFNQCNQLPNESIADYMATLHKMATSCKFQDFLDEALRDRFVSGIRTSSIQKRLLTEEELTSAAALQLAQSMESAQNSSTKLQGSETPSVNYTSTPSHRGRGFRPPAGARSVNWSTSKPCYLCGGKHLPTNCRFIEVTCNKCHKKGHIARTCMSSNLPIQPGAKAQGKQQTGQRPPHQAHAIQGTDPDTDSEKSDSLPLLRVGGKARHPIVVNLTVDGKDIPMEVDTGAAVSIISLVTKEQLFPQNELLATTLVLTTYTE